MPHTRYYNKLNKNVYYITVSQITYEYTLP